MIMAVLLIVFGGLYFANNKQFKGYPIKIGATYPESGNFAIYGESLRNGSILAVEEVNRNGGINGRPFEIIYFDNQGDLTLAISSVNRFINIDKVPIILNSFEFLSLATKNIVEKNKTVMIMSTTYKLTKDDYSSYVFRDYWDFGLIGESFSLAANKIGSNKIGIIAQSDASFNSFKSSFVSNLSGKIVIEERFQYGTKDFKTQLSKLNNSDMDTIVVFAFPVEASIILKQMHDLGMNKYKLIITEASESFVKESNKQFLEKVNAITYLGSELPEKQKEFIEKYQKRFDGQIPRADAMYIYEDVLLLADALKDCEKNSNVTGSCIASKIGNEFDQYHNKSRNLPIVQFKNGLKPFDL
jgi:branched-chain amino acid transport system substrate-binding protein